MTADVAVRLKNALVDRHITQLVSDPSYRSVAPGGFASASFSLQTPIDANDPALTPFTSVYVYDTSSGDTLWEGWLGSPGRRADDQGQVWALTAVGPSAHASDRLEVLVYIDKDMSKWAPAPGNSGSAQTGIAGDPDGGTDNTMKIQYVPGQPVGSSSSAGQRYLTLPESFGMELGAFRIEWNGGKTDTNYAMRAVTGLDSNVYMENALSFTITATTLRVHTAFIVDNFPTNRNSLVLRLNRIAGGSTTVADDTTWIQFFSVRVLGRRVKKDGTAVSGGAGMESTVRVRAAQVVEDLLGRSLLPRFDGANASIASSTYDIDQLAYDDPVTPQTVLDDLMRLEPLFVWYAWESNPANGKYRFEWTQWPTTIQYEASVADGFDSPAPSFEQYNRVAVRWRDAGGVTRTTFRTQAIPELDSLGIFREATVDLGDEIGSSANAVKAGDDFLADHLYAPSSGTLTLARPVLDLINNRMVDPKAIRPGALIRVRGVEGSADRLNASTRDGQTVFRIVSVAVSGDGSAQLELDVFSPSDQRLLAELAKTRYGMPAGQARRR